MPPLLLLRPPTSSSLLPSLPPSCSQGIPSPPPPPPLSILPKTFPACLSFTASSSSSSSSSVFQDFTNLLFLFSNVSSFPQSFLSLHPASSSFHPSLPTKYFLIFRNPIASLLFHHVFPSFLSFYLLSSYKESSILISLFSQIISNLFTCLKIFSQDF